MEARELNMNSPELGLWEPVYTEFMKWLDGKEHLLKPGLSPEPTIKVLIFLALVSANKECTYDDIRSIFEQQKVVKGKIPDNTMRTSVFSLGKALEKAEHPLMLKSSRGRFKLEKRTGYSKITGAKHLHDSVVLLLDRHSVRAEEIANVLMNKAMLPFHALYFLEWSARWWETYSSKEAEIRLPYETGAWKQLGIAKRLNHNDNNDCIGVVGLAPAEGLAEIELLKKLLHENSYACVHYLAVDSSPRLLRDHIGLLKETLTQEIDSGRLICAGVIGNIFTELSETLESVRDAFEESGSIHTPHGFLPATCPLLVTYLGNCLGNNYQDQETEIFSIIYSTFQNRPLEFLVGVSVMQPETEEYKRIWDNFLLQTPRHLLETKKLIKSSRPENSNELPEFTLPPSSTSSIEANERCPEVVPEPYIARHHIEGQVYRFYYKLAFNLELSDTVGQSLRPLPKGTLILLYNIIKYKMDTLVNGIKKCGLFKISYDNKYHQVVDTANGKREYAVFSAYLEKT